MTIASVPLVLVFLPNWPAVATWLDQDEKRNIISRVEEGGGGFTRERASRREILETCFAPRMVAHYLAYVSGDQALNVCAR